jgi:hypothetical protein
MTPDPLPNLDQVERIERGDAPQPQPEGDADQAKPSDVGTAARCLLNLRPMPGVVTADK